MSRSSIKQVVIGMSVERHGLDNDRFKMVGKKKVKMRGIIKEKRTRFGMYQYVIVEWEDGKVETLPRFKLMPAEAKPRLTTYATR